MLAAPRAARELHGELIRHCPSLQDEGRVPSGGLLLRALRLRRVWTLEEAAHRLGCTPGAISRWEHSETFPPAERLESLLTTLGAEAAERDALRNGRLFLPPTLAEESVSLDTME